MQTRSFMFPYRRRFLCSSSDVRAWLLAASAMLFSTSALPDESDQLVAERPNHGGPAEEISVRLALLDIDEIDDKAQRFSIDAYLEVRWRDERLAIKPGTATTSQQRAFSLDQIWTPGLTIVNDRGLTRMLPEVAAVDSDGNVILRQRVSGQLAVDLDLEQFPFDTQQLSLDFVSYQFPMSELRFSGSSDMLGDPSTFSADSWRIDLAPPVHSDFRLQAGAEGRSMLTFVASAQRKSGFFVLTLALPMTLILFMAWMVHWLQPDIIPARIGMSTATVFSLIALGVSFRLSMPQIDYLTKADQFVMYSTLLVLLSLGITVLATRWVNQDRSDAATRLTTYSRWAFPLVFALIVARTLSV